MWGIAVDSGHGQAHGDAFGGQTALGLLEDKEGAHRTQTEEGGTEENRRERHRWQGQKVQVKERRQGVQEGRRGRQCCRSNGRGILQLQFPSFGHRRPLSGLDRHAVLEHRDDGEQRGGQPVGDPCEFGDTGQGVGLLQAEHRQAAEGEGERTEAEGAGDGKGTEVQGQRQQWEERRERRRIQTEMIINYFLFIKHNHSYNSCFIHACMYQSINPLTHFVRFVPDKHREFPAGDAFLRQLYLDFLRVLHLVELAVNIQVRIVVTVIIFFALFEPPLNGSFVLCHPVALADSQPDNALKGHYLQFAVVEPLLQEQGLLCLHGLGVGVGQCQCFLGLFPQVLPAAHVRRDVRGYETHRVVLYIRVHRVFPPGREQHFRL